MLARAEKTKRAKKPIKVIVVVVDDEDEKEEINFPTSLGQALATAFTYNPANPNVASSASTLAQAQVLAVATGTTRRLSKETLAETLSDSGSLEVIIANETRLHASNLKPEQRPLASVARVLPRIKGKQYTPMTSTRRKRRREALGVDALDGREPDDFDEEVEILVDAPRLVLKATNLRLSPSLNLSPAVRAQQHHASIPPPPLPTSISVHTSTPTSSPLQEQSSSPDVNSLAGIPLAILPAPASTEIVLEQHVVTLRRKECAASAHTLVMTADSLYCIPTLVVNLLLKPFLTPTLNVNPFLLLTCRTQKPFMSRKDSQVVYKGRLLQRVYAPQSPSAQLHLPHSG